jgi:lipoprotein-anchoring transpeptidase ErfK/SrfK
VIRGVAAVAVLAAAVAAGVAPGTAAAVLPPPTSQPLIVLLADHATRVAPGVHARRLGGVAGTRPLTGVRTILPLVGTADDGRWLHVRLPGRPSGHTGWIAADGTRAASTPWAIAVDLAARRVTVYERGRVIRRFAAIVGASATPTPRGRFFVEEAMALSRWASGAPFALATSARSSVLQEFDGGPGQIALHGVGNLPGRMGTAASHGCIRLGDRAITWLARRIGAGVLVAVV